VGFGADSACVSVVRCAQRLRRGRVLPVVCEFTQQRRGRLPARRLDLAQQSVASVAQQATDESSLVIVIDAQTDARFIQLAARNATLTLIRKDFGPLLDRQLVVVE